MNAVTKPRLTCRKLRGFEPEQWQRWLQLPTAWSGLPAEATGTEALLARLLEQDLLAEAVRLLAYGLPEREAVWWSCMCVRHTFPTEPTDAAVGLELAALEAAEAWVRQPDNQRRTEAARHAGASGRERPGTWSALGAAWSHRVHELADLCGGRGAEAAASRAALRSGADLERKRLRRFIAAGIDVGNGGAGRLSAQEDSCR